MERFILSYHDHNRLFFTFLIVILLSLCLLVSVNPYRLLLPHLVFPLPTRDTRQEVEFFIFSSYKQGLVKWKQPLLLTGNLHMRLKLIALALTNHQRIQDGNQERIRRLDWKTLPLFGNAIRHVWELPRRRLIINLSSQAMQREIQTFHKNSSTEKKEAYYLDAFFMAFVANIFQLEPNVHSIEFFLDGSRKKWTDMSFDLSKQHLRPKYSDI